MGSKQKISMRAPVSFWKSRRACMTQVLLNTIKLFLGKIIRDMLKDTFAYFPVTVE